ncbi:UPF0187-domain-containing protein [Neoconidiobolus thromboides FSU 785]|nr:UPF0187-domain-containing protein [Neoconidiobolus thromboides FSU 785]
MLLRNYLFKVEGSVLLAILPQVTIATLYSVLIYYIHTYYHNISLKSNIIPSLATVVGLLLVFKTNSSYDRYYEGRKLWSSLKTNTRNLGRYLCIFLGKNEAKDIYTALNLITAYCYSIRQLLGNDFQCITKSDPILTPLLPNDILLVDDEINNFNFEHNFDNMDLMNQHDLSNSDYYPINLPNLILLKINEILEKQKKANKIDGQCNTMVSTTLTNMTNIYSDMQRIAKTPLPIAYKLHLVQTQWFYLLFLPLTLLNDKSNMWVIFVQFVVAFTFFGINAIGDEIENPFGYDFNDLPLNSICKEIHNELCHYFMVVKKATVY